MLNSYVRMQPYFASLLLIYSFASSVPLLKKKIREDACKARYRIARPSIEYMPVRYQDLIVSPNSDCESKGVGKGAWAVQSDYTPRAGSVKPIVTF